ncbi:hypothetical protein HMF8227_02674 [Saliniradius amylolyticus]|uniref:STAS domain-containing protein n=1 Tax=Saliniradius amylolyticus TaxID=2183582 RepID=A0A2S2E640_9ALTE|nr:STAS domain-containing protein [Saliniradius amylolyticus]AWL13126.1 hypothetical protein HMF8227_02674 [Saliniradius amylolyticus]
MAFTCSQKADFSVIEADQELTIFNVAECAEATKPVLAAKTDKVLLDLTAVQDFDSAGLQLVLWLLQQMIKADREFSLILGDNDVITQVFNLYQIPEDFADHSGSQAEH